MTNSAMKKIIFGAGTCALAYVATTLSVIMSQHARTAHTRLLSTTSSCRHAAVSYASSTSVSLAHQGAAASVARREKVAFVMVEPTTTMTGVPESAPAVVCFLTGMMQSIPSDSDGQFTLSPHHVRSVNVPTEALVLKTAGHNVNPPFAPPTNS
jgi:hypothetical protein